MIPALALAALQISSADLLVDNFKNLCILQDGQPEAVYQAADAAGWSPSGNGQYRVREASFGKMTLRATNVDGRLFCILGVDRRVEGIGAASLERAGMVLEARRRPSGAEVYVLTSVDGEAEPSNWLVGADVLADSTLLSFVRPAN